jgi:membrane associated rhomboid family serine protease
VSGEDPAQISSPAPLASPHGEVLLRGQDAEALEEAVLLLAALGLPYAIIPDDLGVALVVDESDAAKARRELAQLAEERRETAHEPVLHGGARAGVPAALALILGHLALWSLPLARRAAIYAAGELDAARVHAGELWRVVTALSLHADPAHVVGNAIATAIFVSAAGDWVGPGLALLLTVVAGGVANGLAALLDVGHRAIGFSTATFGALGLLAVFGFVARFRDRIARGRAWLVLGAGVALLALLGAGERSDVLAHLLGLGTGALLGAIVSRTRPATARVRPLFEIAYAGVAMAIFALAWAAALRRV